MQKRKTKRFTPIDISAKIKKSWQFFPVSMPIVVPSDFNRHGMSFLTDKFFDIGDELIVTLSVDKKEIPNIVGLVINVSQLDENKYRVGLMFDFSYNEYMRSIEVLKSLLGLEACLKQGRQANEKVVHQLAS